MRESRPQSRLAKENKNPEKEVAVLLTDMAQYAKKTSNMRPEQIRDFIVNYHESLQAIVKQGADGAHEFEPSAGDATIVIFEEKEGERRTKKCIRALKAALEIAFSIEAGNLPFTRIGIFVGNIIEARFGDHALKFGNSFAAASRLEELCDFFGTTILMDRETARSQTDEKECVISVGKITPKNFTHPIHVYTVYKPGIHNCPYGVDGNKLTEFIETKNSGMEFFSGNALKNIKPNFPLAKAKLNEALNLFREITGREDLATQRILDYIRENPYPTEDFTAVGMRIEDKKGDAIGVRLLHLSQELFKAMDDDFYHALVIDTEWEQYFRLEWREKGEVVISIADKPDGVYYIDKGEVEIIDAEGRIIASLRDGDIFGEMAYFSEKGIRNASVVATTDLVVRKITSEDFEKLPVVRKIFERIAEKRALQNVREF